MRKKLSKVIALLFILATTLGGAASVFAETEPIPTPGAKPTDGDLTIHKHWAEDDWTSNEGNGKETTINNDTNPPIKGIQFDVYLLKTADDKVADAPPSEKDGWTYTRNDNVLTVSKSGESSKTYTLVKQISDSEKSGGDGKTDSSGVLKYSTLPAGYYYVEENLAESKDHVVQGVGNEQKKVMFSLKPFVVAVPMTNPAGDDWNDDVHVYPKNQGKDVEKVPNKPSVSVGDKVTWTISADVPADFSNYKKFTIVDDLDKRLNYVVGTVVVTGMTGDTLAVTLSSPTDFAVDHAAATDSTKERITIALTEDGIKKVATALSTKIVVTFDTTVNGNINQTNPDEDDENIVKNDATIEFDNGSGSTGEIKVPPAKIHTGEIKIEKTYSGTESITESAQFQLAASEKDAKAGKYLQVVLDSTNKFIEAIVPAGSNPKAVDWVALPSHGDTGEGLGFRDGKFYVESFEGLLTYTESGGTKTYEDYYLVETLAPEGYNLLDEPKKVQFADGVDEHTVHTESILNKKGFTLPNTGGIGTILLVVVGIILIGLAIILTMNKKKKTA